MTIWFSAVYQDLSFSQFHLDEITPVRLPGLFNWTTKDNLHPDSKKVLLLTSGYKQKDLSQFLLATLTVLSWNKTYRPFIKFVITALDKSVIPGQIIFRRDWQKLRHGGLPAGTVYRLKYRDSYRRTAPPTLSAHTRWPLAARQSAAKLHCTMTSDTQARVLQPFPLPCEIMLSVNSVNISNYFTGWTVPALQNTCFFAYPDSAV